MKEILIPFVSALATALGGALVAWLARVQSGRLARTLEQTNKIIDVVERWAAGYEALNKVSEENKRHAEKLLFDAIQAVSEDFATDRAAPQQFGRRTSPVRSALMLYIPERPILWIPYILFHTLILFIFYVLVIRLYQGRWGMDDTVAVLIAGMCAAIVRFAGRIMLGTNK
jgi:hypothetical protein